MNLRNRTISIPIFTNRIVALALLALAPLPSIAGASAELRNIVGREIEIRNGFDGRFFWLWAGHGDLSTQGVSNFSVVYAFDQSGIFIGRKSSDADKRKMKDPTNWQKYTTQTVKEPCYITAGPAFEDRPHLAPLNIQARARFRISRSEFIKSANHMSGVFYFRANGKYPDGQVRNIDFECRYDQIERLGDYRWSIGGTRLGYLDLGKVQFSAVEKAFGGMFHLVD